MKALVSFPKAESANCYEAQDFDEFYVDPSAIESIGGSGDSAIIRTRSGQDYEVPFSVQETINRINESIMDGWEVPIQPRRRQPAPVIDSEL